MHKVTHLGLASTGVRVPLVAGLVVALLTVVAVRPAAAQNTFLGAGAGQGGFDNTAIGASALTSTNSVLNTATGENALANDTSGCHNTATGAQSLLGNTTGNYNIAIGFNSGSALTSGDHNIDFDNIGVPGEHGTIRIGTQGTQIKTVIAGINGSPIFSGAPVLINSFGRLGVGSSSARYKHDIRDMGAASSRLMKLRPVTFRYNGDPKERLQYGLVAEEVAHIYPELVTYGNDGKPEAVAYQDLPPMLLNEVQKQARENQRKDARIAELQTQVVAMQKQIKTLRTQTARIDALTARLVALEQEAGAAKPERLAAVGTR
jgi:Chaperone of endosialidase